ncbi:MAG: hypothetical protein MUC65_07095 [Pontiellaceae bacterium]|jgi:hypothetical protein|nr:hypothetical protein [Pontiellaceae bacterium]
MLDLMTVYSDHPHIGQRGNVRKKIDAFGIHHLDQIDGELPDTDAG